MTPPPNIDRLVRVTRVAGHRDCLTPTGILIPAEFDPEGSLSKPQGRPICPRAVAAAPETHMSPISVDLNVVVEEATMTLIDGDGVYLWTASFWSTESQVPGKIIIAMPSSCPVRRLGFIRIDSCHEESHGQPGRHPPPLWISKTHRQRPRTK